MKRIIYSLVLMFAVGGFFTSCIDNAEPVGVQKMREAHAEYVKACAELQKAKIAIAAAEASRILAEADYQDALTADQISQTKRDELMAELERAAKALENETDEVALAQAQLAYDKALEAWKMELAEEQLAHEATMVKLQKNLEKAQQALADYRREVELAAAKGLTDDEKAAIDEASNNYAYWTGKHADAIFAYANEYANQLAYQSEAFETGLKDFKANLKNEIETLNYNKKLLSDDIDYMKGLRDTEVKEWVASLKKLDQYIDALYTDKAKAEAALALAKNVAQPELEAEYDEQIEDLEEEIAALKIAAGTEPAKKVGPYTFKHSWNEYGSWVTGIVKQYLGGAISNDLFATAYQKKFIKAKVGNINDSLYVTVPYTSMDTVLNALKKTPSDKFVGLNTIISEIERNYRYSELKTMSPEEILAKQQLVENTVDSLAHLYEVDKAIILGFEQDLNYGSDFLKKVDEELKGKLNKAKAALQAVKDKKDKSPATVLEKSGYLFADEDGNSHSPFSGKWLVNGRYYINNSAFEPDSVNVINAIIDAYKQAVEAGANIPDFQYVALDEVSLLPVVKAVKANELKADGFKIVKVSNVPVDQTKYIAAYHYAQYDNKGYNLKWRTSSKKYDWNGSTTLSAGNYVDALKMVYSRIQSDIDAITAAINDIKFLVGNKSTWTVTNWQDLEGAGPNSDMLYAYLTALQQYTGFSFNGVSPIKNYSDYESAAKNNYRFFDLETLDPEGIFFTNFTAVDLGNGYAKVTGTVSDTDVYTKIWNDFKWSKATFEATLPFQLFTAMQYGNVISTTTVEYWNKFVADVAAFEAEWLSDVDYNTNVYPGKLADWKASESYKEWQAAVKALEALKKAKTQAVKDLIDPLKKVVDDYNVAIGHQEALYKELDGIYGKYSKSGTTTKDFVKDIDTVIAKYYNDIDDINEDIEEAQLILDQMDDTNLKEMAAEYFKNRLDSLAEDVDQAAIWADYYKKLLESLLEKYITVAE